jgi:hypothetical protein
MASKNQARSKPTKPVERDRLNIDLGERRARWTAAAARAGLKLTPFITTAVEEKIRRDGLG